MAHSRTSFRNLLLTLALFLGQTQALLAGQAVTKLNMTRGEFDTQQASNAIAGRKLMDIDVRWTGSEERYNAIWHSTTATIYTLIQGTSSNWSNFISQMGPKNGRYLDVEVGYFGGAKRYSAIFYEDGDNYAYALRTTNDDAAFQNYLRQYLNDGLSIIDFEAYTDNNGDTKFAGVWVGDPNQPKTTLYYGLRSNEVSDLINPRIGRVIDLEYYYSSVHGERRWAMIFAADSGGEQFQRRGDSESQINNSNASFSDSDTDMIDIESYKINGVVYYAALWGDTYKSLHEVARIAPDSRAETVPTNVSNLITQFENQSGPATIGLYAKNVRTNQSIAYRENEPFYLASTAKIPINIKFWREVQNGHLSLTSSINYTSGINSRAPWYTGNRLDTTHSSPTFHSHPALGINDFGQSFTLSQYDGFMMDVSDNAATSLLMDDPDFGLTRDSYDINEWLADIDGVGQGWGLVTSIQDVDRNIMWQGQVQLLPDEPSYFRAPSSALEAYFRPTDCDGDTIPDYDCWSDLRSYYGVSSLGDLPLYLPSTGRRRYFAQGLNTASPKATTLILEKLREGLFLDATNTQNAINSMTEHTPIDNSASWPSYIDVQAKGGTKGTISPPSPSIDRNLKAISDAGIIDLGPDAIVLSILTEWNNNNNVRSLFTTPISYSLLQALAADLSSCLSPGFSSPSIRASGQPFRYVCTVANMGGGDASAFTVDFYASKNTNFSTSDYLLGSVNVNSLFAGTETLAALEVNKLPEIPDGEYYVGWVIDPNGGSSLDCINRLPGGNQFGNVGESDECNNFGYDTNTKLSMDSTEPVLEIKNAPVAVNDTDPYPVTFIFSEDVSGFTLSDIAIRNGSASRLVEVSANTYYTIITPVGGDDIDVIVSRGAARDSANNPNKTASAHTRFDITAPTISIQNVPEVITNTSSIFVVFQFSENVKGFTLDDIQLSSGQVSGLLFRGGGRYTAVISPTKSNLTISVAAGVVRDDAGNPSTTGADVTIAYNYAPRFTSPINYVVGDRATAVGLVTATDDEGDPISLSIFSGVDRALFSMNPDGLIRFISPADFENPMDQNRDNFYVVAVEAFDGYSSSYQWLNIRVDISVADSDSCNLFTIPFTATLDGNVNPPITEQRTAIFCL